jgi:hypothetical protein
MNNAFCDALGTTPNYYMFGTHPDAPVPSLSLDTAEHRARWSEVVDKATRFLIKSREKMMATANKKRRNIQFKVNDTVLLSTKHPWFQTLGGVKKLIPAWSGPFRITEILHGTSCVLDLPEDIKTHNRFHTSLLKHYHPRTRVSLPPAPTRKKGHDYYEVDQIVGYRKRRLGRSFIEEHRVAFVNYGPEYNRWLPLECLSCKRKIAEYHERRKKRIGERTLAG